MKYVKISGLNKTYDMPIVGVGSWRALPEEVENALGSALDAGYRLIDTAFNYNTEESIGKVLKKWIDSGKGKRADLFLTTKLPNFGNRPECVEKYLKLSLKKLQTDYIDLYLIHTPFSFHCDEKSVCPLIKEDGTASLDISDITLVWKELEKQVKKGLARAIGLSNFNMEQTKKIFDIAEIKPAVLQVELHAYLQQKELRAFCKKLGIAVEAFSPLGSPGANVYFANRFKYTLQYFPDILGDPVVTAMADKYKKTPAQILLRHLIQQDIIVIPKSKNPERLAKNIDLFNFELAAKDMDSLNALDKGEGGRILDFLFFKGVENHPEYPFKDRLQAK